MPARSADGETPVRAGATLVCEGLEHFQDSFREITARARRRFASRDWLGGQSDAEERLDLYPRSVGTIVLALRGLLGDRLCERRVWRALRRAYATMVAGRPDVEIAETFFNSVTRRIFSTVGVNREIEFVNPEQASVPAPPAAEPFTRVAGGSIEEMLARVLTALPFASAFNDLRGDARAAAAAVATQLADVQFPAVEAIETLPAPFFRSKHAYVVGRLRGGERIAPLLLALRHGEAGIEVDAVLTSEDEVSIVFSFARSYFHVELERPGQTVAFLRSIMPRKPIAELYIAIGYNKHGKTELYRSLLSHLARSSDRFELARGDEGLVMIVFTLPSLDVVFKVIKDFPGQPKTVTREGVIDRYRLVFTHDRVGRLVDAQEFEHLRIDRDRFEPHLLERLLTQAGSSVALEDGAVVIHHVFTERRVTPMNLYLRETDGEAARQAVLDYGAAIKELAAANIFPGDLLLKNFGVTRHGRVVFYDYDELCLLTECRFRRMPPSRSDDDELAAEPWFYVAPEDVFPEELRAFLGLEGELREVFLDAHADLFEVELWQAMQERQREPDVIEERPYREQRRLRSEPRGL